MSGASRSLPSHQVGGEDRARLEDPGVEVEQFVGVLGPGEVVVEGDVEGTDRIGAGDEFVQW
jgi:hypothetical protein